MFLLHKFSFVSVSLKRLTVLLALCSDCVLFNLCSSVSNTSVYVSSVLISTSFLPCLCCILSCFSMLSPLHLFLSLVPSPPSLALSLFECFYLVSLGFVWRPEARSHTAAAILKRTKEGPAAGLYPKALPYAHIQRHTHTQLTPLQPTSLNMK